MIMKPGDPNEKIKKVREKAEDGTKPNPVFSLDIVKPA
jgi:hypothetical protein